MQMKIWFMAFNIIHNGLKSDAHCHVDVLAMCNFFSVGRQLNEMSERNNCIDLRQSKRLTVSTYSAM